MVVDYSTIEKWEASLENEERTPDEIINLPKGHYVYVGTNTEGRSNKGFALTCKTKFGLTYGHTQGICGQTYAIITKDLRNGLRSVSLDFIQKQVKKSYEVIKGEDPDTKWYMTKIGTNHAGFSINELKEILFEIDELRPENVILPYFK